MKILSHLRQYLCINPPRNLVNLTLATLLLTFFSLAAWTQESTHVEREQADENAAAAERKTDDESTRKKDQTSIKYRLLQSNGLLVETAYHQEDAELQHGFSLSRTNRRTWQAVFTEEIPLGSKKHQLSLEAPIQFFRNEMGGRGAGDVEIGYSYMLFGSNLSSITFSPGFAVSLPTGDRRRELGRGAAGFSVSLPASMMIGKRFASNTVFETTFTPNAKNAEGERADLKDFEVGQSLVWFTKPKLNFLLETVWERRQEVAGDRLKISEREFYVSPGVRWAHKTKNLLIVPGIGVPFGLGPSSGERGIVFSIAFEHSLKKEIE